jgi:hypothetical protein
MLAVAALSDETSGAHLANWDIHNKTRALYRLALLDLAIVTEDHNTDVGGLEVESHA